MKTPIIITNFKAYETSIGNNAVALAKIHDDVAKGQHASIAIAAQAPDIFMIKSAVSIPVLAQHVDGVDFGAHTGRIHPRSVKEAGAEGTLLNHAEKRLNLETLEETINACKAYGLTTVVCAEDIGTSKKIAALAPDFIAVEPPELIGGNISVSAAKPELVKGAVDAVKSINEKISVLVGAGIRTKHDVGTALELGADGILLASAITKAKDPKSVLLELVEGLK